MGERFELQQGAIGDVAQSFTAEADRLESALPGFESAAYSVNDAFGPWGVSREMLQEYLDTAYEALKGLNSLCTTLGNDAERLSKAESNYADAESASTYGDGS